jgi:MmyB-like transcription regulator ligand binding domain/Helix-turn-helix domain
MAENHQRRELAMFLRARRAQLKPHEVGLPEGVGRRRTPGLRREEVSQLSGIGLTWYTWLEQGRDIHISEQVVKALVTTLRLSPDDRSHLYALAGIRQTDPRAADDEVSDAVRRMLGSVAPNPAYVINDRFDLLAWNRAQSALWLDPATVPAAERNLLWLMFTEPTVRGLVRDWQAGARALLAQFRAAAGQHADDPRYAELADRLRAMSPEFADWWETYPVANFDIEINNLNHPIVGGIQLDLMHLRLDEHPTLTVVLQTPTTAEDAARLAALVSRSFS